ncbi:DUF4974 domain-containing protein [Parapedobacter sp. SGR-10]|uniref:FecR family protein n=1 Tax=Parapedobacter sp. SGR-10 TaxID=2710879 RepID=UPI0013CFC7A1|nr:FecR domain-containing protein [Parapedobacter sp. SGR-10]NGF56213.1 DUF4974 domain-containing protein [Parapedobacter sp. SGR-10]
MDKQRLIYLIKKHQQGICLDVEKAELYALMQDPNIEKDILLLWNQLHEDQSLDITKEESGRMYAHILSRPEVSTGMCGTSKPMYQKLLRKAAAVAAMLAICVGAYLLLFQSNTEQKEVLSQAQAEVLPGSNKARIVFEDGTFQELGKGARAGVLESDFFTIGDSGEEVSYLGSSKVGAQTTQIHTLITPIGGEYVIQLADGTKVWLNADSKLKYPVSFNSDLREVELEGEAYFDVAKVVVNNRRVPFVVKSKGQVLEVLGTEFNVNTFRDKVTTTLIEGSVLVSFDGVSVDQPHILRPNEQATYDGKSKKIHIVQIDPYYVTAWKSGDFAFDNAPLENVMEDIARWYDVSIEYKSKVSDVRFSGKVSKFENIETLLQTIEWTGSVKLKLDGRRIIVMK